MSTLVPRTSRRSSNKDVKPTTADLEELAAAQEVEENLPSSRKASETSGQIKAETEVDDEIEQTQTADGEIQSDKQDEEAEDVLEEEKSRTESLRESQASGLISELSVAGQSSLKSSEKPEKKPKLAFTEPQSGIQSTTSNYRVTRLFDSISVSKRRQSSAAPKPVLKFQPSYRLESSNPFNALSVEDFIKKFVENRMEEVGKIDFANHRQVQKISEKLSYDILQEIKAKEYDRYRIAVKVDIVEKFHQTFRERVCCLWDSETDAMATFVYDRHDLSVITTVFGVYYD